MNTAVIERPAYLAKLVSGMNSDQVKVVTGVRRCGKSFLVFKIFREYLLEHGVAESDIFEMAFDRYGNKRYRDPDLFYAYAKERLADMTRPCYVLLDEVQLLGDFAEILIDLMSMEGVDVYVTGSNAKMLSKDVVTEFRGRGREIRMAPLSFSEFMATRRGDVREGYFEYATYGGLPAVVALPDAGEKAEYLENLYDELYLRDIVERGKVRDEGNLSEIVDVLSSSIGSLSNALRISSTFKTEKHMRIAPETVERYIQLLEESFLISRARRYDLKGRHYIGTPYKFYFCDMGLRNARMNFRQVEQTHIMENVLYNELIARGFGVDVGVVNASFKGEDGAWHRRQLEIDFVCNRGDKRVYVQSAYAIPTDGKLQQETRSLTRIDDGFRKVIVTKDGPAAHYNESGILMMNIYDFLLDPDGLEL